MAFRFSRLPNPVTAFARHKAPISKPTRSFVTRPGVLPKFKPDPTLPKTTPFSTPINHLSYIPSYKTSDEAWVKTNSKGKKVIQLMDWGDWAKKFNHGNSINFPPPYDKAVKVDKYHRPEEPLDLEEAREVAREEFDLHYKVSIPLEEYLKTCDTRTTNFSIGGSQITQHEAGLAIAVHHSSKGPHRYFLKIVEPEKAWRLWREESSAYILSMWGNLSRSSVPKVQVVKLKENSRNTEKKDSHNINSRYLAWRRYFAGADGRLVNEITKAELKTYLGTMTTKDIAKLWVDVYAVLGNVDRFNDGNIILSGETFYSNIKKTANPIRHIDLEACNPDEKWMEELQYTDWKQGDTIPGTLDWCLETVSQIGKDNFVETTIVGNPGIRQVNPLMSILLKLTDNNIDEIKNIKFTREDFEDMFKSRKMLAQILKTYQLGTEEDIIAGKTNIQRQIDGIDRKLKADGVITFGDIISGDYPF